MGCKRFAQGGCAGTSWPALTSSVGFLKCRRTDESNRDPQTPLETPVIGAANFEGGAGAGGQGQGLRLPKAALDATSLLSGCSDGQGKARYLSTS